MSAFMGPGAFSGEFERKRIAEKSLRKMLFLRRIVFDGVEEVAWRRLIDIPPPQREEKPISFIEPASPATLPSRTPFLWSLFSTTSHPLMSVWALTKAAAASKQTHLQSA